MFVSAVTSGSGPFNGRNDLGGGGVRRRTFGPAQHTAEPSGPAGPMPRRSGVDARVPELRRRIADTAAPSGWRLPWAVGASLIVTLSFGLWLNAWKLAGAVAQTLDGLL